MQIPLQLAAAALLQANVAPAYGQGKALTLVRK